MPERTHSVLNEVLDSVPEDILDGDGMIECPDSLKIMRKVLWELDEEVARRFPAPEGEAHPAAVAVTRLAVMHFLWLTGLIKTSTLLSMIGVASVPVRPEVQPAQRHN